MLPDTFLFIASSNVIPAEPPGIVLIVSAKVQVVREAGIDADFSSQALNAAETLDFKSLISCAIVIVKFRV